MNKLATYQGEKGGNVNISVDGKDIPVPYQNPILRVLSYANGNCVLHIHNIMS